MQRLSGTYPKNEMRLTSMSNMQTLLHDEPDKKFYPANEDSVCEYMKMTTLEKLYVSLKYHQHEVKVPADLAEKAYLPQQRMLEIA